MLLIIKVWEKSIDILDAKITLVFNTHRIVVLDNIVNFISNLATPMLIASIAFLFFFYRKRKQLLILEVAKKMLFSFAICASLTFIFKNIIQRQRPFKVNTEIRKLGSGGSFSYPSGHTADAFVLCLVLPLAFPSKIKVKISCFVWAIFIAYSRLYLGVHYITDIFASILLAKFSVELSDYFVQKKMPFKPE